MMKPIALILASAAALAASAPAYADVQSLIVEPGKGVSFFMGVKHGVTIFQPNDGACDLTVAISDQLDADGNPQSPTTRVKMSVVPGKPARLETGEGHALIFFCNKSGQTMTFEMPPDFKYKPKG